MELMKDWGPQSVSDPAGHHNHPAGAFAGILSCGKAPAFYIFPGDHGNDPVSGDPADRRRLMQSICRRSAQMPGKIRLAGFQGSCRHTLCRNPGAHTRPPAQCY